MVRCTYMEAAEVSPCMLLVLALVLGQALRRRPNRPPARPRWTVW